MSTAFLLRIFIQKILEFDQNLVKMVKFGFEFLPFRVKIWEVLTAKLVLDFGVRSSEGLSYVKIFFGKFSRIFI